MYRSGPSGVLHIARQLSATNQGRSQNLEQIGARSGPHPNVKDRFTLAGLGETSRSRPSRSMRRGAAIATSDEKDRQKAAEGNEGDRGSPRRTLSRRWNCGAAADRARAANRRCAACRVCEQGDRQAARCQRSNDQKPVDDAVREGGGHESAGAGAVGDEQTS
jgi:hypothetical protein